MNTSEIDDGWMDKLGKIQLATDFARKHVRLIKNGDCFELRAGKEIISKFETKDAGRPAFKALKIKLAVIKYFKNIYVSLDREELEDLSIKSNKWNGEVFDCVTKMISQFESKNKNKAIEKIVLKDFDEYKQAVKFYYDNKARIKKRWLMMLFIEEYELRPEVQAVDIIKVRLGAMKPTQEQLKLVFGDYIAKAEIMAGKRQLTGDIIIGLKTVFGFNPKVLFSKIEGDDE